MDLLHFWKKIDPGDATNGKSKLWLLLLLSAAGILLILFGGSGEETVKETETQPYSVASDEMLIYQAYLEERVQTLCRSVRGVGNVTVAVTLSDSFSSVYATEICDGNEEYVILGSGSSASALYLNRAAPQIVGIGIVCSGGSDATVRRELISLLSAAFDIGSNRIYITEAGGS